MRSQKKAYATPRLTKHGLLVQLTAEYVPGVGQVVEKVPEPPPAIQGPATPGSDPASGVAPSGGSAPSNESAAQGPATPGSDPASGVAPSGGSALRTRVLLRRRLLGERLLRSSKDDFVP